MRAPIAGVIAGLRAAAHETVVFLPVDCPLVTPELLRRLGDALAVPQTGPLPGAYAKDDLPVLERRLAAGELTLRGVNPRVLEVDERLLANANTPGRAGSARDRGASALPSALNGLRDDRRLDYHGARARAIVGFGQRSKRTSPLATSSRPDSVSTASRPSRSMRSAMPALPSTSTRRPRRKSRAPMSS